MSFLTNWIFWVLVAAIVFALALIGYLSESKKKNQEPEETPSDNNNQPVQTEQQPTENQTQETAEELTEDWNVMPEINANTVSAPTAEPTVFNNVEEPAAPVHEEPVQAAPVAEVAEPTIEPAPVSQTVAPVQEVPAVAEVPVQTVPVSEPVAEVTLEAKTKEEPASIFNANVENVPSPATIPAKPEEVVNPTTIPEDTKTDGQIETL